MVTGVAASSSSSSSASASAPVISHLLGKLKPPLILSDAAWIPKFRQTCYPQQTKDIGKGSDTTASGDASRPSPANATPSSSTNPPQPTSWQRHLSSAPSHSFTISFADLLTSRPPIVFFGEQHHQPHVIGSQIQLFAALADQRDQLNQESTSQAQQGEQEQAPRPQERRTVVHHLHLLLEHFSYADQHLLDRFRAGSLSISELCSQYRETSSEGFKIEMYAPLLLFARERGATIWGGFPPRTWAREMVKEGLDRVKDLEDHRAAVNEPSKSNEDEARTHQNPPNLPPMLKTAIPHFASWDKVRQLSASHRTFLSSLMKPDGPPRFPISTNSRIPVRVVSALNLYPTQDIQGPKEEDKGFSPAQALKDSYLAHAASSLVQNGHLLARNCDSDGDLRADDEVEHRNIVLVVAGLGHVEAGFGAPERLEESLQGRARQESSKGSRQPLIILSKPKDSSLWLGPEWVSPTSFSSSQRGVIPSTQGPRYEEASSVPAITQDWLKAQILSPSAGQVAGHEGAVGTLTGPSGEALIAKKSIASEAKFYEELNGDQSLVGEDEAAAARRKAFAKNFTPKFYGAFPLSSQQSEQRQPSSKEEVSVVCEDLLAPYHHPNVMDVKLGTQLWDDDATQEKRDRMDRVSRETTSGSTGVRLTGWRTWDAMKNEYHVVPKAFGKSIKVDQLSLGVKAFFGQLQSDGDGRQPESEASPQGQLAAFQKIMEDCGISSTVPLSPESSQAPPTSGVAQQAPVTLISGTASSALVPTLPSDLVHQLVCSHLLPQLEELTAALSQLNTRMRGASLLVVWEGHVQRLQTLLQGGEEEQAREGLSSRPPPPPLSIHLIDFAHSRFVSPAGDAGTGAGAADTGRDEGVLLGLRTVRRLVEEMVGGRTSPRLAPPTTTTTTTSSTATPTTPTQHDAGWDRKLADALVLYDWVDVDGDGDPDGGGGGGGDGDDGQADLTTGARAMEVQRADGA